MTRRLLAIPVVVYVVGLGGMSAQEPKTAGKRTADDVLQLLSSNFYNDRAKAVDALESSADLRNDPRVRDAVVAELHRVKRESDDIRNGVAAPPEPREGWGEYELRVADCVALLNDPRTIDDLLWYAGNSRRVASQLAAFGETAAPTVLSVLESGAARGRDLLPRGLMHALQTMLQTRSVSAETAARITTAAHHALTQSDDPIEIEGAIDLAAAVRNPTLLADVAELARGVDQVTSHGVGDRRFAEMIQRHAARVTNNR